MRKWFGLLAAVVLSGAIWLAPTGNVVLAEEAVTVSDGDGSSNNTSTTSKTKLEAPSNIHWQGWCANWNLNTICQGYYSVFVYKNDKCITKFAVKPSDGNDVDVVVALQAQGIAMEEGASYSFDVTANANIDPEKYETSAHSEMSEKQVWGELAYPAAPKVIGVKDNFRFYYETVEEYNEGIYRVKLLRNGESIGGLYSESCSVAGNDLGVNRIELIDESGEYQFRVRYENSSKGIYGAWAVSEPFQYTKPDAKMSMVIPQWDAETAGTIKITCIEAVAGFQWEVYKYDETTGEDKKVDSGTTHWDATVGTEMKKDLVYAMKEAGKYKVRTRILSPDLVNVAHGDWSKFTEYYDTTKTSMEVSSVIAGVMEQAKTDAAGALAAILDNTVTSAVRVAMQTDATVLKQMAELEKEYRSQEGIVVDKTTASEDAKVFVDTEKIEVIGAAFNAVDGKVNLDISVPAQKEEIDKNSYSDNVQLDIKLVTGGTAKHDILEVPVSITMPVPKGIDVAKLKIIHYYTTGGLEYVDFKNRGDGTITFTVDRFSTFVFANQITGDDNGGNDDNQGSDESQDEDNSEENEKEDVVTPAKDNVPKTGDCIPISVPMMATVMFAVFAGILKKNKQ